nr:MAG TPA: hypothetical protein [Caudoviricetes sp.]
MILRSFCIRFCFFFRCFFGSFRGFYFFFSGISGGFNFVASSLSYINYLFTNGFITFLSAKKLLKFCIMIFIVFICVT